MQEEDRVDAVGDELVAVGDALGEAFGFGLDHMIAHRHAVAFAGFVDAVHDGDEIGVVELPGQAHRSRQVVGADHDGVEAGMGQDGVELFHGADVFDLRDQQDVPGDVFAVGVEVPAVHVGAGIAHAPAAARVGVQGEADGPVELFAGFDHGEDEPLRAGVQRVLDGAQFRLRDAREGQGTAPLDGPEHVRQDGPRERAVFHVRRHPVVAGGAHHFRDVRRGELQPRADCGPPVAHHRPYFPCRFHRSVLYGLEPLPAGAERSDNRPSRVNPFSEKTFSAHGPRKEDMRMIEDTRKWVLKMKEVVRSTYNN